MKFKTQFLLFCIMALQFGCQDDEDSKVLMDSPLEMALRETIAQAMGSLAAITMPESNDYPAIPGDPNNPITSEKVVLGKFLFHETEMAVEAKHPSGLGTYSCASCHHVNAGFQSGLKQGIGDGGVGFGIQGEGRIKSPDYAANSLDVQPIRSPTALNVAFQEVMLWNGQFGATGVNAGTEAAWSPGTPKVTNALGFQGVETQAIAGLGVHRLNVNSELLQNGPYKSYFDEAFPGVPENERYTLVNAGLAIAAYERTLFANEAPFQRFLKGETHDMSDDELQGGIVFYGKGKCYECHSGPGMNGLSFHALGMNDLTGNDFFGTVDDATRRGRGGFTGDATDDYKFKTPQLYNLKDLEFFGHGGSFSTVRDIIEYKNAAIAENQNVPANQLAQQFEPLNLTEDDINHLTLFIENALYDANLGRYVPETTPAGSFCFPNADTQSQQDLGCNE